MAISVVSSVGGSLPRLFRPREVESSQEAKAAFGSVPIQAVPGLAGREDAEPAATTFPGGKGQADGRAPLLSLDPRRPESLLLGAGPSLGSVVDTEAGGAEFGGAATETARRAATKAAPLVPVAAKAPLLGGAPRPETAGSAPTGSVQVGSAETGPATAGSAPTGPAAQASSKARAQADGAGLAASNPRARLDELLGEKASLERRQVEQADRRSAETTALLSQLKSRDSEVRAHEAAHMAAGGRYITGGASYTYQRGPDGAEYAVGGEVGIDTSTVPGRPEETAQKMSIVRAAALAPSDPSAADLAVAAEAAQAESEALAELAQARSEEAAARYAKAGAASSARTTTAGSPGAAGAMASPGAAASAGAGTQGRLRPDPLDAVA